MLKKLIQLIFRSSDLKITTKQIAQIKKRGNCPFYGFTRITNDALDSNGNGCGLIGGHTPCKMGTVDWGRCKYNTENNIQKLSEYKIYPKELTPNSGSWGGIKIKNWMVIFKKHH